MDVVGKNHSGPASQERHVAVNRQAVAGQYLCVADQRADTEEHRLRRVRCRACRAVQSQGGRYGHGVNRHRRSRIQRTLV